MQDKTHTGINLATVIYFQARPDLYMHQNTHEEVGVMQDGGLVSCLRLQVCLCTTLKGARM